MFRQKGWNGGNRVYCISNTSAVGIFHRDEFVCNSNLGTETMRLNKYARFRDEFMNWSNAYECIICLHGNKLFIILASTINTTVIVAVTFLW